MKFVVKRSSSWDGQPCPEATVETVGSVDRRTRPIEKLPFSRSAFMTAGRDHRFEAERCSRVLDVEVWVVDGDILTFIEQYGQCVVTPPGGDWGEYSPPMWAVEIYDDYRE